MTGQIEILEGFHIRSLCWVELGTFEQEFKIMDRLFTARTKAMSGALMLDKLHITLDDWSAFRLVPAQ